MKDHHYDFGKLIEKIRNKLDNKVDQDNRKICAFFRDSFGKSANEIDPEEIKETYFYKNPVLATEEGERLEGWDEIKAYLGTKEPGTECDDGEVEIEMDYLDAADPDSISKNDIDLNAHVKTAFIFGGTGASAGSDPDGEGDLKHRRTCVWEP